MKAKQTESSLSFLQRFEGKKSTVTKDGLHHLFDLQLRKTKDRNSDEQEQKQIENQDTTKLQLKSAIKSTSSDSHIKQMPSSRLNFRTQILGNKQRSDSQRDEVSLPKIPHRFNNSHNDLHRNSTNQTRNRIMDTPLPPKKLPFAHKNLGISALQHLQFLTRLQQKLNLLQSKN